jgi:hypothetical protein
VNSQGRDVTKGIQPKFVYQSSSPNYYEPVEHWEVDENTNVDVFEETKENYPKSSKYAKVEMNALDEISQSYSHQGNLKLDQTKHTAETWDHESVDSEMIRLFSKVCAFYEKEGHLIMDCPFVPFHIRTCIIRHVELQNVAGTLMDQP